MKGISRTLSVCILVAVTIAALAFLFWNLIAQFYQLHIFVQETSAERQNINLANVIISHEKFAIDKNKTVFYSYVPVKLNGKIEYLPSQSVFYAERGILDSEKLDKISYRVFPEALPGQGRGLGIKPAYYRSLIDLVTNPKNLDIGYPNTYTLFGVTNYDECEGYFTEDYCPGWMGSFMGKRTLEATPDEKFIECLANNLNIRWGSIFRFLDYGILGALWEPIDFDICTKYLAEEVEKKVSGMLAISFGGLNTKGIPILIKNGNDYEIGRLYVGVIKWF